MAFFSDHEGDRFLSDNARIARHDGCRRDVRMGDENLFEFARVHVVPLVDQHVLGAVCDVDVSVVVTECDVTGVEPPVDVLFRGDLRMVEIARGHLRPPHPETSPFSGG